MNQSWPTLRHDDAGYPARLRALPGAPHELHVRHGDDHAPGAREWPWTRAEHCVAIVGARAAEAVAVDRARSLARDLAGRGAVIVSGGALGVDAAAHVGALEGHAATGTGATVAVLGCGIDVVYPARHQALYDGIRAAGGALVSQFRPGTPPRPANFVRRNAVIAGLADAVVVIGAGATSGALHTVAAARRLARVVAAMPGSAGCDALIAHGAAVVTCAADVWQALAGRPRRPFADLPAPGSPAARVLALLHAEHACVCGDIATRAGLGPREVARALTGLELDGLAIARPGQSYVRSALAEELLAS